MVYADELVIGSFLLQHDKETQLKEWSFGTGIMEQDFIRMKVSRKKKGA